MKDPVTHDALTRQLGELADAVRIDSRWRQDDLSVDVLGMLLYGYAMMTGRGVFAMDMEDIDAAMLQCLTEHVGAAAKWSQGLVAEARASALNKAHHPIHFGLIGAGHAFFGAKVLREERDPGSGMKALVDNVFANIDGVRRHVRN